MPHMMHDVINVVRDSRAYIRRQFSGLGQSYRTQEHDPRSCFCVMTFDPDCEERASKRS